MKRDLKEWEISNDEALQDVEDRCEWVVRMMKVWKESRGATKLPPLRTR